MALANTWICPTCRTQIGTAFCPACGERPLHPRDLKLRGLLSQAFTALTSVDSKVLRSFRCLLLRPGALTMTFLNGQRKPFVAALPLFLLANVLFFATQSFSPEKVFSSSLSSHLHQQDWQALAQQLLANKLSATRQSISAYAPIFDQAVALNAKSLVILMVVPLFIILPLLFRGSARPFAVHAVFALHSYAFQLVLLCSILLLSTSSAWIGAERAAASSTADHVLFAIYLAGCAIYLFLAIRIVYGGSTLVRALQTTVLTVLAGAAVVVYRFLLFLITLYTS